MIDGYYKVPINGYIGFIRFLICLNSLVLLVTGAKPKAKAKSQFNIYAQVSTSHSCVFLLPL